MKGNTNSSQGDPLLGAWAQTDPTAQSEPLTQADIVGPASAPVPGSEQVLLFLGVATTFIGLVALLVYLVVRYIRGRSGRNAPRKAWLAVPVVLVIVGAALAIANRPPKYFAPEFPPIPRVFSADAFYYQPADTLPVHPESGEMIAALGDLELHPSAGSEIRDARLPGRPFNLVSDSTKRYSVSFQFSENSYPGKYPITDPAYIESAPAYQMDNHYIGVDFENGEMYELGNASRWWGDWRAAAGTLWDLNSLEYPRGRTTGSGLPMLPGLFTYEEVAAGSVNHVISVSSPINQKSEFVWPARATDGTSTAVGAPPMGSWFRLGADTDLRELGPQARVIAQALMDHGMVIADTSGVLAINGTPDLRWDDSDLATLRTLSSDDFEVVDASRRMVSSNSMEMTPADSNLG